MVVWLKQAKFDIWKLSPQSCISFFSVFFWQETYYSPKENICSMDSLKPPRHPFFSDLQPPPPSFSTFGIEGSRPPPLPPGRIKEGLILCILKNLSVTLVKNWLFSSNLIRFGPLNYFLDISVCQPTWFKI